jgi:hypothetical protein
MTVVIMSLLLISLLAHVQIFESFRLGHEL